MNTLLITAVRVIAGPANRVTADGAVLVDGSTGVVSAITSGALPGPRILTATAP